MRHASYLTLERFNLRPLTFSRGQIIRLLQTMQNLTKNITRRRKNSIEVFDKKHALDLATAQSYSENVFLFVPNLIGTASCPLLTHPWVYKVPYLPGYTRIILAGLSLHFMSYHPKYCTLLYSVSCLLDAVDGHAARALGQTSKFGAVLDMVTDRSVSISQTEECI